MDWESCRFWVHWISTAQRETSSEENFCGSPKTLTWSKMEEEGDMFPTLPGSHLRMFVFPLRGHWAAGLSFNEMSHQLWEMQRGGGATLQFLFGYNFPLLGCCSSQGVGCAMIISFHTEILFCNTPSIPLPWNTLSSSDPPWQCHNTLNKCEVSVVHHVPCVSRELITGVQYRKELCTSFIAVCCNEFKSNCVRPWARVNLYNCTRPGDDLPYYFSYSAAICLGHLV